MGRTLGDPLLYRRRKEADTASNETILEYLRWQVKEYGHAVIKEASVILHAGDVRVGKIARDNNIAYAGHGVSNYTKRKPKPLNGVGRTLAPDFAALLSRERNMTSEEKKKKCYGGLEYRGQACREHTCSTGGTGIRFNGISQPRDVEASMLHVW